MFIGYAVETLRDKAPRNATSTLRLRQSSLRGMATIVANSMGHDIYPATQTAQRLVIVSSERCGIPGSLIPSLSRVNNEKAPSEGDMAMLTGCTVR